MKETYIPFDTLKKLVAKGFPMRKQVFFAFYEEDKSVKPMKLQWDYIQERTLAPTIEEVLKWLRDEKKLYISIEPHSNDDFLTKMMWTWDVAYINSDCKFQWNDGEFGFDTYEKAAVSAIENAIDKD